VSREEVVVRFEADHHRGGLAGHLGNQLNAIVAEIEPLVETAFPAPRDRGYVEHHVGNRDTIGPRDLSHPGEFGFGLFARSEDVFGDNGEDPVALVFHGRADGDEFIGTRERACRLRRGDLGCAS
jgi:hypothetical protein